MSSGGRNPTLEDGVTCSVCLDPYDEGERRPLMLPACGHTFCHVCLAGIMAKGRSNSVCPACRRPQLVQAVQDLPVNYSLLDVIRRKDHVGPSSSPSSRQDNCLEHKARLAFWCLSCEVAACGECLFDAHPTGVQHNVVRIQEQMTNLLEMMKIRSNRVFTQLVQVAEENITELKLAFITLVEHLRQRRAIDRLLKEAERERSYAKGAEDLASVTSVHQALVNIQREFEKARITTATQVSVANRVGKSLSSSDESGSQASSTSLSPAHVKTDLLEDLQTTLKLADKPATLQDPDVLDTSSYSPTRSITPLEDAEAELTPDPLLLSKPSPPAQPGGVADEMLQIFASSPVPDHTASPVSTPATSPPTEPRHRLRPTPTKSARPTQISSATKSTQTGGPRLRQPGESPEWTSELCGVLNGNWTSGRMTLERRGLHVYSLKPLKEKCDIFLNLSVVCASMSLETPLVFLDLKDGDEALGRVYIILQTQYRRAQQFVSLCLGDRGPSYQGSYFHSVLRRGNVGEGLIGGDYEGKAGKGGAAIFDGIEDKQEVPKRCEKGMVVCASLRSETAAQFLISVKDGPRPRMVFPFGRVCEGLDVVDAACRRPAFSVSVADCGLVLPV
ncbi:uncharacterized protein [Panulirus ornatus]|uniref:uncharacterized protein n=1 Tax=Panulirus ornatus TaxID=150431 RepID=UPI003A83B2E2